MTKVEVFSAAALFTIFMFLFYRFEFHLVVVSMMFTVICIGISRLFAADKVND